jgi:hypothetical protein
MSLKGSGEADFRIALGSPARGEFPRRSSGYRRSAQIICANPQHLPDLRGALACAAMPMIFQVAAESTWQQPRKPLPFSCSRMQFVI